MNHLSSSSNNFTVTVKENVYHCDKESVKAILDQAKNHATPGAIYAIQKRNKIVLLNEISDGEKYAKDKFKIMKKELI